MPNEILRGERRRIAGADRFDTVDDCSPEDVRDVPNGAKRRAARARGVDATVVAGQVVFRDGEPPGARPGTVLLRAGGA